MNIIRNNLKLQYSTESDHDRFLELMMLKDSEDWGIGLNLEEKKDPPKFALPNPQSGVLKLTEENSKVPMGFVQYFVSKFNRVGQFLLIMDPEFRGRKASLPFHLMTIEFLFTELNAGVIVHHCLPGNFRIRSVIEASGMRLAGYMRDYSARYGSAETVERRSCLVYELTRSDFQDYRNPTSASSRASYGINDEQFKKKELTRLGRQSSLPISSLKPTIEKKLRESKDLKIVDLGCGTGDLLASVYSDYPHLKLVGLDSDEEFISVAKSKYSALGAEFTVTDFLNPSCAIPEADIYIMRYVAQHLGEQGLREVLRKLSESSKNLFEVIILDIDDRSFHFEPQCEAIHALLDSAGRRQYRYGGDRRIGLRVPHIGTSEGFSLVDFSASTLTSKSIGLVLFDEIIDTVTQDCRDPAYFNESDYEQLRSLVDEWKTNEQRIGAFTVYQTVLRLEK